MEAMSPIAMWVDELARTPEKFAALKAEKGSLEKPEKKVDVEKVEVDVDVENAELKKELKLKVDAEVELKVEVELTRERLREMQGNVEMMERLVEGNELRFQQEIGAEREYRRELEARLDALDRVGRTSADSGLKVRELELREREFELAERKYAERKAAEDDNAAAFECCLSISDPAGDVLCDLSMLRPLDDHLRNEKRSVTTVAGLLSDTLAKSSELRLILANAQEYSAKFVLQRFENVFKSLHKISSASLSVIKILVMAELNQVKVKAAVKYAGSRFVRELVREIPAASKSGSVPVLTSEFKVLVLSDLPGIAELLSTRDKTAVESHWRALEDFVSGVVCHVKDVRSKLQAAVVKLDAFSGKLMPDADTMLGSFNELFDVCSSWLGVAIENDYVKIQRFLKKVPESVKAEYAFHISAVHDGVRIDELTLEWEDFEGVIGTVWESSSVKAAVRAGLGLGRSEEEQKISAPRSRPRENQRPAAAAAESADSTPLSRAPSEVDCRDCKASFVPSRKQTEKFEMQGIQLPDTCPKCKGQVCDVFRETGDCSYGTGCKFLHPAEFEKVSKPGRSVGRFGGLSEQKCRFATSGKCLKGDRCEFSHEHAKTPSELAIVPFSRSRAPEIERVYMAAVAYSDGWTQEMEDMPFEECYDTDE